MNKNAGKRAGSRYQKAWESSALLKEWIQGVPDQPDKAFCKFCNCLLYAHRYSVLKHAATKKHQSKSTAMDNNRRKRNETEETTNDVKLQRNLSQIDIAVIDILDENLTTSKNEMTSMELIDFEEDHGEQLAEEDCDSFEHNHLDEETDDATSSEKAVEMSTKTISTHILDTSEGKAGGNVPVTLFKLINTEWTLVCTSTTDNDGRCMQLIDINDFSTGSYKLHFNVHSYFSKLGKKSLYPFVEVTINCEQGQHYHIPLLLNAFGYSTYRGT